MDNSYSKDLFDCISWFSSSHESSGKSELVQRYSQELGEIFKLSGPILKDIFSSGIALDEHINQMLQNLSNFTAEARKLDSGWQQMMSKIYFVLQIEAVIPKTKTLLQEAFSSFDTASKSVEQNSYTDYVENIQKLQHIPCERISDTIKDAIQEQMENVIPRSEFIEKIENSLSLSTNEELLTEIVALDKLKAEISCGENHGEVEYIDRIIELVNYMHSCHVDKYQLHSINNVPIPADFCCPLSLELMFDPVIVASGQTYERSYIKKWLERGFTVCPKTRQVLSHTNLIPNYTVKALIGNWCETNNINLPDPTKSNILSRKDTSISNPDKSPKPADCLASESNVILKAINRNPISLNGHSCEAHMDAVVSSSQPLKATTVQSMVADESGVNVGEQSLSSTDDDDDASSWEKQCGDSGFNTSSRSRYPSHVATDEFQGQTQSVFASPSVENSNYYQGVGNDVVSREPSDATHYRSDASGELTQETPLHRDTEVQPNMGDLRSRANNFRRHPSDRFGIRIISSSFDTRHDLSGIETQVRKLVEELQSDSIDEQRNAVTQLRHHAKHSTENRIIIANCSAIPRLVSLLQSEDPKTQENAVTALLNLSINDNNKMAIANADAIDPLIHVLKTGTAEAKENSAATLFSLSVIEENKAKIGRSGAIIPLVELLSSGTPRGKKDASTALFNLSIFHENKSRIVQAGAVRHLVELMDPAAGMVDKAVAVLANLATIPEGRSAIGREGGIPCLVEVVELGSARGKENAAAALLQLCTTNSKFSIMVLQEGAVPPLVALFQSGTPRAKEKAQSLLAHFRNQRHGNHGRA